MLTVVFQLPSWIEKRGFCSIWVSRLAATMSSKSVNSFTPVGCVYSTRTWSGSSGYMRPFDIVDRCRTVCWCNWMGDHWRICFRNGSVILRMKGHCCYLLVSYMNRTSRVYHYQSSMALPVYYHHYHYHHLLRRSRSLRSVGCYREITPVPPYRPPPPPPSQPRYLCLPSTYIHT